LNADTIKRSGVTVPIYIFPEAVDIAVPDVRKFKLPNFNGVLFYSIFEWNERKNPRALLEAYWREFKGEYHVGLLIKVHKGSYKSGSDVEIVDEIKRWKNEMGFKETPRVFVCTNILTEEEKHRLHETGDCFVLAHRGEGWCIPAVEASLHRKPVIAPKFGGVFEYFSTKHFYPVDYTLVPIDKVYNKYYEPGMNWADVNGQSLREKMRDVFEMFTSEKRKGLPKIKAGSAHNLIETYFNYEVVGGQMLARLQAILDNNG
jgi:glycosyltransferase involved in cell wall biosynthesis